MSITVLYFANLRERLGRDKDQMNAAEVTTIADIWSKVAADMGSPDGILVAINHVHASFSHSVSDGDEIAFFPPVTGG